MKAHTSGDPACCTVLRGLRRFTNADDAAILKEEVSLQEIQLAVALRYGQKDWAALRAVLARGAAAAASDAAPPPAAGPGRVARLEAILARGPASGWTLGDLIAFFKAATGVARYAGLVAIQHVPGRLDDPFLQVGMRIVTDGTNVDIVHAILVERKRTLLADHGRRLDVGTAGLLGVATGESPMIVAARCRALLPAEIAMRIKDEGALPVDLAGCRALLDQILAAAPASRWPAEALIRFLTTATHTAQVGGLAALESVYPRLDDWFLRLGLQLAVDGADPEIIRSILGEHKRTLLADFERRLDLIIAGTNAIGRGENPAVWETRGEAFLPEESSLAGRLSDLPAPPNA